MTEHEFQLVRGAAFVLAILLAAGLQRLTPHARMRGSVGTNAGLWLLNGAVLATVCGACACTVARWAAAADLGLLNRASAPLWVAVPVTIVALDFVSYLWHRANHVVPTLWRFHRVHHSDVTFTASTALRFHPGELVLSLPLRLLAVALLGAPVVAVVTFEAIFTVANLLEHGDIDVPPALEGLVTGVVVTPALHRFHHTRAGAERDHNFGTILAIWDRALRTYRPCSSSTKVDVGVPEIADRLGLTAVLLLPLRAR
jgi:sterol desaturase/sphingolipid hydroxylase (fatty acid hydroxylase superfamily)